MIADRTLTRLLDIERRRLETAQRQFAQIQRAHSGVQQQTSMLQTYRSETLAQAAQQRLQTQASPQLSRQGHFLRQLDTAVQTQLQRQHEVDHHLEQARLEIARRHQRLAGLQKLQFLEQQRRERRNAQREQTQLDERAQHPGAQSSWSIDPA
jgi:flagellar export protein FliJ